MQGNNEVNVYKDIFLVFSWKKKEEVKTQKIVRIIMREFHFMLY